MRGSGRGNGGEPNGARLLRLARRELLDKVLPALEGDDRYRTRLIANAMKIAAQELEHGAADAGQSAQDISAFAETALAEEPAGAEDAAMMVRDALRSGRLDGNGALHELLGKLTRRRRDLLG